MLGDDPPAPGRLPVDPGTLPGIAGKAPVGAGTWCSPIDAAPSNTYNERTVAADAAGGNVVVSSNFGNVIIIGAAATGYAVTNTAAVSGQTGTNGIINLNTVTGALTVTGPTANANGTIAPPIIACLKYCW